VGGQHGLEAQQVARGCLGDGGQHAGLEGPRQPDGPPLGGAGLDLVGGLVVGETIGVVVGRVVVGVREVTSRRRQQPGDDVVVVVRGDRDGLQPVGPLGEQRTQLRVTGRVVADVTDVQQASRVVDDGDGEPAHGARWGGVHVC
jgi:hypothetical protein